MPPDVEIAVDCTGCGRTYHLPPPKTDQRAKCRGCGQEFVIPATAVSRRVERKPPRGQAAEDRLACANLASKLVETRGERVRSERRPLSEWGVGWIAFPVVGLAIAAVLGWVYVASAPKEAEGKPPENRLARGRVAKLASPRSDASYGSISELIQAVEPAVVQVRAGNGVGSGFVLDPAGLIVTCHHCVEGRSSAEVVFANGIERDVLGVRASDVGRDLVVLEVLTGTPLPALPLTDERPLKGEPLVTFGSPAGLAFTVSEGSVSALRTASQVSDIATRLRGGGRLRLAPTCDLVQFTATSMPGHSGGPVVDFRGNVIGVTSFGLPYQGRSFEFAISYTEIRDLSESLSEEVILLKDLSAEPAEPTP